MKNELQLKPYRLPLEEIPGCGAIHIRQAVDPMEWERHDRQYELLYVKSGEKRITVCQEEYVLHGDDLLVIHPDEPHGNYLAVQNRSKLYFVLLRDPACGNEFLHLSREIRLQWAKRLSELRLLHLRGRAKHYFLELFSYAAHTDELAAERIRALSLLLLDSIFRECTGQSPRIPPDIRRVLDKIENQPSYIPQITEMARTASLSEAHFKQKFKQCLGMPPAEYIARARIVQAKKLLSNGSQTIQYVSEQLGFSSAEHFSRSFRRYVGLSPSAFRRQFKQSISSKEENCK